MAKKKLPITCPVCGLKNEFPLDSLAQGSIWACPHCNLKLKLHGHMWEDIQADIRRLKKEEQESS